MGRFLLRTARRSPMGLIGICMILFLVVAALLAPYLSPFDPKQQDLRQVRKPPGWSDSTGNFHLLGTDHLGRDLLARILSGLRISLAVGLGAVVIAAFLGTLLGLISGYLGGVTDAVLMRIVDIQLSIPYMLIALIWAAFSTRSLMNIIIIVAVRGWVTFARVVRGEILSLRERAFIESAKAIGISTPRILFRHLLPQVMTQAFIVATFFVGTAIILESALGFLGLGVPPPTPTLGGLLNDGRRYITIAWWLTTFPGVAIMLIVLGVNLVGDGLRDVLDPRLKE